MNAVVEKGTSNALAAIKGLKAGLQNVASSIKVAGGDPFLRLTRAGEWVYGAESIDVQVGSLWAVNPLSLQHGWVSWTDHPGKQKNEIVGEVMVPMTQPLPPQHTLPDTGWKWSQQLSITLKCLNGDDVGQQVLYKSTSHGGLSAIRKLIDRIEARIDDNPATPVPVVTLSSDSYAHQKWGETFTPVFDIQQWAALGPDAPDVDEPAAAAPAGGAPAGGQKPKQKRRAAAAVPSVPAEEPSAEPEAAAGSPPWDDEPAAEAPAEEPEAPVRRRRRVV